MKYLDICTKNFADRLYHMCLLKKIGIKYGLVGGMQKSKALLITTLTEEEFKNEYERELQSRASQAVKEVETDTFVANGAVYQMLGFITNDELHWTVSKETIKKYFTSTGGFENDGVWIDDHAKQVRKEAAARARKERKKARAAELSSADTAS